MSKEISSRGSWIKTKDLTGPPRKKYRYRCLACGKDYQVVHWCDVLRKEYRNGKAYP